MRLLKTLGLGVALMFILAYAQQLLLTHLDFGPVMLMIEVRGILISLTFYMFIHLLYQNFHNQQVSIALERSKMDNLGAQYELLRQQVNPHFLFNSLNTLKYMVESNDRHSVEFILKLSDFYRFTLESRKSDLIRLSEELKDPGCLYFPPEGKVRGRHGDRHRYSRQQTLDSRSLLSHYSCWWRMPSSIISYRCTSRCACESFQLVMNW